MQFDVLILEINQDMNIFLSNILTRAGYNVIATDSLSSFLNQINECAFRVIIFDKCVNENPDTLLKLIRENSKYNSKIIIIDGFKASFFQELSTNQDNEQSSNMNNSFHLKYLVKHIDESLSETIAPED